MKCLRILSAILLALCLSFQYAQAQTGSSMTDKQVKEYIIREHNKGTSPQQIITKLVEKGVPVDQLRRVKKIWKRNKPRSKTTLSEPRPPFALTIPLRRFGRENQTATKRTRACRQWKRHLEKE